MKISIKNSRLLLLSIGLLSFLIFFSLISIVIEPAPKVSDPAKQVLKLEVENWQKDIRDLGGKQAYARVKEKFKENKDVHFYMHIFGKSLYENLGQKAISVCDSNFFYGCYHGVFSEAISKEGINVIHKLDDSCIKEFGSVDLECKHGIGHGLMEYFGKDRLVNALEGCFSLREKDRLGGCSSGVFMEYNAPIVTDSESAVMIKRPFNAENPDYPCDEIEAKYKQFCYFELSKWWEATFLNEYKKVGQMCAEIDDPEFKVDCYLGLGIKIAKGNEFKPSEIIKGCSDMPDMISQIHCRIGGARIMRVQKEEEIKNNVKAVCSGLSDADQAMCNNLLYSGFTPTQPTF